LEDSPGRYRTSSLLDGNVVVLGGVMVSVLTIGPKILGFKPGRGRWILKSDKTPQHDFLRMESKAVGHMSQDFTAC
jgi:hypothetical protein